MGRDFSDVYIGLLRQEVIKDLQQNPVISKQLGKFKGKFIKWCAKQRYEYEKDLQDEFLEFEKKFITSRLYHTDVKLWRALSAEIFERDLFTCNYCGIVGGILEIDHVKAISKGGTNHQQNLVTACRKCNRQKKDKSVKEFEAWRVLNV